MRILPSRPASLSAALALLVASTAAAQPAVDPARYVIATFRTDFETGANESTQYTTPGDYATKNGNATVRVRTSPYTLLSAHATTDKSHVRTGAQAYMYYNFMFFGDLGTHVVGTFTADMFASVMGSTEDEVTLAISSFRLYSPDGVGGFYDSADNPVGEVSKTLRRGGGTARFDTPVTFTVDANAMYQVELRALAQTATKDVVVDAYIDPIITIDPAFRGYTLVLSPGVSNLGPTAIVPEPGTLLLVGTGVVGVVGVVRRRRAVA